MLYRLIILLTFLLSTGCAYIEYTGQWPPSDSQRIYHTVPIEELIYLIPDKDAYSKNEKITGIFKNVTHDTLYIYFPHGGGDSPLQKWNGKEWETLNTRMEGVSFTQAVRNVPILRGTSRKIVFPHERLREKNIAIEGTYRFLFTISFDDSYGSKSKVVCSRPFIIQ